MRKKRKKWTKFEKESILKDIQRVEVVAGCRKHAIAPVPNRIGLTNTMLMALMGWSAERRIMAMLN